jgi:very-short-patch-repair endonuclease
VSAVRLVLTAHAFVCGLTAAWLYGIDVQDARGESVWVGHPKGLRIRARVGMVVRELAVEPSDLHLWGGIQMTTRLRTVFDCARWLNVVEAVVVADFFAHLGAVSGAALAAYAVDRRGVRGIKQVDRVVELIEPLTESPMESRLRLLLAFAGLTGFDPQYTVKDRDGKFVARVDFAYVHAKLIVEYDGAHHWKQRREDERRREAIRDLGWTVRVVSSEDYYRHPERIIAKVREDLGRY